MHILATFVFSLSALAFADDELAGKQEEPDSLAADELRETSRLIQAELPRWYFAVGAERADLKLDPHPILRWTNPGTGRIYGEIYVWTAGGRPEAIMSVYKAWEPAWGFHGEFHSLSLASIIGRRDQAPVWKCDQPGVALHDVPDAPAPAETARRRLQQMHTLANDFSAVLIDRRRNPGGERQALRLLVNPVYRYVGHATDLADGAIFAFVLGTDAEVLLLLEARGEPNQQRWQYALARLNRDELAASFKEQQVWRVERGAYHERDKAYFLMGLSESPP